MKSKIMMIGVAILFIAVIATISGAILNALDVAISKYFIIVGAVTQTIATILLISYGLSTRSKEKT